MNKVFKKALIIFMCSSPVFGLVGCAADGGLSVRRDNSFSAVSEALQKGIEAENIENELKNDVDSDTDLTAAYDPPEAFGASTDGIDVDLTQMSATMVFAEVFYMMNLPDQYIGKKVKAEGEFATYLDETTGKMYYACIVKDATECCAQGLEFIPADERMYPDDFPAEGDDVCVVGVFDTYMDGENTYGVLRDAKISYGDSLGS